MASLGNSTVSNWAEPESSRLRMFMDFLNKPKPNSFRSWALSIFNWAQMCEVLAWTVSSF